ncbi:tRNA (adenosine(37)-N6)-threonylcarbamoyltransferase complex ATPase subunit type 1 TsaE [Mesoplasma melaleucae]|uniref:tRNA threonylcarbamoyladenosine biosynthesis protein TsaE n=1 Tax=Mesoplasma melaleucae TaxID=81459 RepID=A0A2K8NWI6_9MOLU|nr:tRNA (adenosine(37)-N6)-threonylcarbamoyltransferase complex ATPase subunit type 1 TsaE [Mesoplasma melaleucae]ATZ18200.1 tRNA (N6-adenosine(37)-N6)-threonylcarbamoyltransferase complex ATPase TsaE [Mesoplasma melaleucae]
MIIKYKMTCYLLTSFFWKYYNLFMIKTIISNSVQDTNKIAQEIANTLSGEVFVLLTGDLGAGKTTFTKALIKQFGVKENVSSPTFTILNQYQSKTNVINHMDAYRLDKQSDLEMFIEEFDNAINIIEWWTNINLALTNKKIVKIEIKKVNESAREFIIESN